MYLFCRATTSRCKVTCSFSAAWKLREIPSPRAKWAGSTRKPPWSEPCIAFFFTLSKLLGEKAFLPFAISPSFYHSSQSSNTCPSSQPFAISSLWSALEYTYQDARCAILQSCKLSPTRVMFQSLRANIWHICSFREQPPEPCALQVCASSSPQPLLGSSRLAQRRRSRALSSVLIWVSSSPPASTSEMVWL